MPVRLFQSEQSDYAMKTQLKTTAASFVLFALSVGVSKAQRHPAVSHNPVKDAASAWTTLFSLPEGDSAYYFRADLPDNNFLTIQFGKLSYWEDGALADIFATAKTAWRQVQDSFTGTTTSRKIAVHVPPSNYPMLAVISEYGKDERTLLLKGNSALPLRIAVDTITILKTQASESGDISRRRQILYTFLLKDLSEIEGLANNAALIGNISSTFDSLVVAKRRRWKNQDASFHSLDAQYDVRNGINRERKLQTGTPGSLLGNFDYNIDLGVSFVAGSIASYGDFRLLYHWVAKERRTNTFIALSLSTLGFVKEQNNALSLRSLAFLNVELGSGFSGASSRIPLYRTSVGIGYRIAEDNAAPYDFKYCAFFNYSVSKAITITPELYSIPTKGEQGGDAYVGITLSLRLL